MVKQIAKVSFRCTKEELQAAMREDADDRAALLFFLIGAKHENLMLQGRAADAALAAACRLLHISDEGLTALLATAP
jgi:hypothetical protein